VVIRNEGDYELAKDVYGEDLAELMLLVCQQSRTIKAREQGLNELSYWPWTNK
jgi:hypothetical protein